MTAGGALGDDIIAAARRGESSALTAVYEAYSAQVLGYVRGLGVTDPEDTLGEVFVSVVRNIATFRGGEEDFRRWLFTIAHRRVVDAHRRRARDQEHSTDPSMLPDVRTGTDAVDEVAARLSTSSATQALEHLTDDQREVILLRIVADLSVADAAEILGKKPGAVKTLQRRALASLRRLLILPAVS